MYFTQQNLMEDLNDAKIDLKDVFFHINRMSSQERKRFVEKSRKILLVKS